MFLLMILSLVFFANANAQPFEAEFAAIFSTNSVTLSGNSEINLQDIGLGGQSTLKSITIFTMPTKNVRLRYSVLPYSEKGTGQLNQQITLGDVTYGPKGKDDKQHMDAAVQFKFLDNRFDVSLLPISLYRNGEIFLLGSVDVRKAELSIKGIPNKGKNEITETVAKMNKTLFGVGIGGIQRFDSSFIRYRAIYSFGSKAKGLLADVDFCYRFTQRGFVGIGYYYDALQSPLDDVTMKSVIQGAKAQIGFSF